MAVRFVIGRAGAGKTRRCLEGIAEEVRARPLGEPIYYLLPKQATFQAERELMVLTGGYSRVRVVSFEQIAQEVLAECGGLAIPEITSLGRQMILGHLLRKHEKELRYFAKVARHASLAPRLDATLAEMERCGKGPDDIKNLMDEVTQSGPSSMAIDGDLLSAKLHDLHLLYHAYTQHIGQEMLDPGRRMQHVLASISRSRTFQDAMIYVDGFSQFSDSERRLLCRMASVCGMMEITILLDPSSPVLLDQQAPPSPDSLFHPSERLYRQLHKVFASEHVEIQSPVLLREIRRFSSHPLSRIESKLFSRGLGDSEGGTAEGAPDALQMAVCPSPRAEVEHAARQINELIGEGVRFREIALLVRDLDRYHDLINAVFDDYDIPFFVDRRRSMAHHPLLRFIRAILAIAQHRWPHDASMQLIKSGLAGLSLLEADQLENYVLEHRLRGSVWTRQEAWNWCRRFTRADVDELTPAERDESKYIDSLRRRVCDGIKPFLEPFATTGARMPVREIAAHLFATLSRFDVPRTLATWIEDARAQERHEEADEHQQVWAEVVKLFEQMVNLIGAETATLADFREILEAGLETFDLALTPPTVDQVLVGQVDRTRTPEVKAALVLGLNDGVFPQVARETSVLSDVERNELEERGFEIDPDTQRRLLDENLLAYIAFTRPAQRLFLSRFGSDESGRAQNPSPYWLDLLALFPEQKIDVLPPDDRADASLVSTPRQLLTHLMWWARQATDSSDGTAGYLYQWLATTAAGNALDAVKQRVWGALSYDNAAFLSEEVGKALFARPLRASVSQIESFAACPFRHFLRYALHLRPRDESDVEEMDLEGAFHQVLERLVREMLKQKCDWSGLSSEQCEKLVREYAQHVAESLRGEMMLSDPRNQYLLGRVEKTLDQIIGNQKAVEEHGAFRTSYARVEFGLDGAPLPALVVQTRQGEELHLRGRIDRIDVLEKSAAFAVMDYRLFGGDLRLTNVYYGLSLQLLTYLLVMEAHGEKLAGKKLTPAAAFYVRLLRQLERVEHPEDGPEPDDPKFTLRGKQRGLLHSDFFDGFDNQTTSGASQVVAAYRKKDGSFGHRDSTDVADADEFAALLNRVKGLLSELGEQILSGKIDIAPYRMSTATPCPNCDYRAVCRFDPTVNRYHHITPIRREEVLQRVLQEQQGGSAT